MNAMDLNEAISSRMTEDGVESVTMGTVACANVREMLRGLLKAADAESYAEDPDGQEPERGGLGHAGDSDGRDPVPVRSGARPAHTALRPHGVARGARVWKPPMSDRSPSPRVCCT